MKINSPHEARELVVANEMKISNYSEKFAREIYCSPDSKVLEREGQYIVCNDPWHECSPMVLIEKETGEWRYLGIPEWREPHGFLESFHPVDV